MGGGKKSSLFSCLAVSRVGRCRCLWGWVDNGRAWSVRIFPSWHEVIGEVTGASLNCPWAALGVCVCGVLLSRICRDRVCRVGDTCPSVTSGSAGWFQWEGFLWEFQSWDCALSSDDLLLAWVFCGQLSVWEEVVAQPKYCESEQQC